MVDWNSWAGNMPFNDFYDEMDETSVFSSEFYKLYEKVKLAIKQLQEKIPSFSAFADNIFFLDDDEIKNSLINAVEEYKKLKRINILHRNYNHIIHLDEITLNKLKNNSKTGEVIFEWKKIINPIQFLFKECLGKRIFSNSEMNFIEEKKRKFDEEAKTFFTISFSVPFIKQSENFLNREYSCKNIHVYPFNFEYE
jgi:hypothetical protein